MVYMDNNRTEKATINIGIMELAQIDLLVENMIYTNRSDFIRTAIRNQLEMHKSDIERLYLQTKANSFEPESQVQGGIGIYRLRKAALSDAMKSNKKLHIMVMGILLIDKDISPELFEATVESIKIYGKIQAQKSILELINRKGIKSD